MTRKPKKGAPTLQERVERLERFRYRMLGVINAQNVIIADLLCDNQLIPEEHSFQALEALRKNWLVGLNRPTGALRSADPVEGDLIAQEFQEAVDRLTTTIAARLRLYEPSARS
jgi:hypothetical protein